MYIYQIKEIEKNKVIFFEKDKNIL